VFGATEGPPSGLLTTFHTVSPRTRVNKGWDLCWGRVFRRFGRPCQRRTAAKTQGERLRTFLVSYGEGKRSFTDGADACDGVEACA
jgi:hypothetical protein